MTAPRLKVSYRAAEALVPYARNSRTHSEAQVSQIAASIKEFGWTPGRACYAIEIAPQYVDVGVRRWQAFTGKDAVRESDGKTFNEAAA